MYKSIRDYIMPSFEEIKSNEKEHIVIIRPDKKYGEHRYNTIVIDKKLYLIKEKGVGKSVTKSSFCPPDDYFEWEEYEKYETVYLPIFDITKISNDERKRIEKMTLEESIKFGEENKNKIAKLGVRLDGVEIILNSEYEKRKYLEEREKKYKNLRIVERYSNGNLLVFGVHLILSEKVSKKAWEKIKHCFRYFDSENFNDEVWGEKFKGYEIIKDKIEELEELLEIPDKLKYKGEKN